MIRKQSRAHLIELPPPPRRRRRLRFVVLGLVAAPYLYEAALILVGRWMSLLGRTRPVGTPLIDRTADAGLSAWRLASRYFNDVPWRPDLVILAGLAWCLGCSLILRKR